MGKLVTYMFLMIGIVLLLNLGGFIQDTPNNTLLNLALNPENTQNTNIYLLIVGLVGTVGGIAIVVLGGVTKTDFLVMAGLILPLFNIGWDFLIVFQTLSDINPVVALLALSPIFYVYIITVIEWWRGIST